jgi:TonB family protein
MKRVIVAALIGAALFVWSHRAAYADVEFCPATLHYQRVGAPSDAKAPGALYGFDLTALGARTIASATLAFDTNGGWYTVDVPGVTLVEKPRRYRASWVSFTRREYASPILYARFPKPVIVAHAWVYTATTHGDSQFGWDSEGTVQCDPIQPDVLPIAVDGFKPAPHAPAAWYTLDSRDRDPLWATPQSGSFIEDARISKPLESTTCAAPFRDATVKDQAQPQYPVSARAVQGGEASTTVEVAIDADGRLHDAWVWGPSGYTVLDQESLRAARQSTYEAAQAYCKPVPSTYFFRVTFSPGP